LTASDPAPTPRSGPPVIVGIDLGTSHTALSWARPAADAAIEQLPLPQWVAGRRWDEQTLLPSVLYAPLEAEMPDGESDWLIGEYARIRARETSGRSISSAKSWLCHAGINRQSAILPWGESDLRTAPKLSPVDASQRILEQVRRAFEQRHGALADAASIVLTVPASFDPTARKLVVLAAERAGLRVRLLEEPLAAFYEYLGRHAGELEALADRLGRLSVLVVDVGGGTTDFSLIEVELGAEGLRCRRSAVGRHLLLGGDNMDLAVARLAEQRLGGGPLSPDRWGQLLLASQRAKEVLLGPGAPESFPMRLLSGGARLFDRVVALDLGRAEVEQTLMEGFFPLTPRGEGPRLRRSGLTTVGLPYERDAAVTRHLWEFIARHAGGAIPEALLLNGGVASSPIVAHRLRQCLTAWAGRDVVQLPCADSLLSVSRGAVRYGLSLCGHGARVEGGAAHGYYIGVGGPGEAGKQALCVVPRGAQEGERHVAGTRRFELTLGRRARFDLYASDTALHAPGALVEIDSNFQALPQVALELAPIGVQTSVEVQIEGELSAVGTLELGCVVASDAAPRAAGRDAPRFSLEFELNPGNSGVPLPLPRAPARVDRSRFAAAEESLLRVFGKGRSDVTAREVKDLLRTLERQLGERKDWDLEQNRQLVDVLLACQKARLRSEEHERLFWMLAGFGLRPGFGHPGDGERVAQLWSCFDAGLSHRESERNWQHYWIAWRRVAGGLEPEMQRRLRDLIDPVIAPAELKLKKPKAFQPLARGELLDLVSQLERVEARRRAELGGWILERTWVDRDPRLWTYLGRIGARVPTYAPPQFVVPASIVERWVQQLLRERWSEVKTAAASAFRMARVTGDQSRDLGESSRHQVAEALARVGAPEEWRRAVLDFVPVTASERAFELGDDLPLGLRLLE
jgi:hypothetical protein